MVLWGCAHFVENPVEMLAQPEAESMTWIRAEFGNLYHDVTKNFSDQAHSFALLQDSVANAHEETETLIDGAALPAPTCTNRADHSTPHLAWFREPREGGTHRPDGGGARA